MTNSEKPSQKTLEILTNVAILLIRDAARICVVDNGSVEKDIDHVRLRAEREGLGFFTKNLPQFGTHLNSVLASGQLDRLCPPFVSLKVTTTGRLIPVFLSGFYEIIADAFDVYDAELSSSLATVSGPDEYRSFHAELYRTVHGLDSCSLFDYRCGSVFGRARNAVLDSYRDTIGTISGRAIAAIRAVRQISMFAYKLKVPLDADDEQLALLRAIERDQLLPDPNESLDLRKLSKGTRAAVRTAVLVLGILLADDPRASADLVPKHGPGALATGEKNWEKWSFKRYYEALDECFPYSDYFYLNYSHLAERLDHLNALRPDTPVSRATCVPKDSRGPRVINMEPLELMFIQQALKGYLYDHVEKHELTRGRVNFTSQDVNRDICLSASVDLEYQTLDLKDASDRVSLQLVDALFPAHWVKMLRATRSVACDYGILGIQPLRKFAPMGSALCFPIESLVFWALSVGALHGDIILSGELKRLPDVYVFGDDIIVPSGGYMRVKAVLEELSLIVNEDKSCTSPFPFRESCGMDAINGVPIPVIRIKEYWPEARLLRKRLTVSPPEASVAWCEYANAFTCAGYALTGQYLSECIRQSQWSSVTHVTSDLRYVRPLGLYIPHLHWLDVVSHNAQAKWRFNKSLQRMELRVATPQPVSVVVDWKGWELLQVALTRHSGLEKSIWLHRQNPQTGELTLRLDVLPHPAWGERRNTRNMAVPNAIKFGYTWIPADEILGSHCRLSDMELITALSAKIPH